MTEHPCQNFVDEWVPAWLRVYQEQYEAIAAHMKAQHKLCHDTRLWCQTYGNIHAIFYGVGVERVPGEGRLSRWWSRITRYDVEFFRLLPLYSSDEYLSVGIICDDRSIGESIRFHLCALAEPKNIRLNYLFDRSR